MSPFFSFLTPLLDLSSFCNLWCLNNFFFVFFFKTKTIQNEKKKVKSKTQAFKYEWISNKYRVISVLIEFLMLFAPPILSIKLCVTTFMALSIVVLERHWCVTMLFIWCWILRQTHMISFFFFHKWNMFWFIMFR